MNAPAASSGKAGSKHPSSGHPSWSTSRFFRALALALVAGLVTCLVTALLVFNRNRPDLVYDSVDYDVQVLDNGDLRISQTLTVTMNSREDDNGDERPWRELYQRYQIKPDRLTGISDVSVTDLTNGSTYRQADPPKDPDNLDQVPDWDKTMAGTWYMGTVSDAGLESYNPGDAGQGSACGDQGNQCQVELGWNIPQTAKDSGRRFRIDMTFHGVTTAHSDVAEFQWEPVGDTNQIPVEHVSANVKLPKQIGTEKDKDAKAWLHFAGRGSYEVVDDSRVRFSADRIEPGQHLDLVVLFDAGRISSVVRTDSQPARDRIVQQERQQYERWHTEQTRRARIGLLTGVLALLAAIALIAVMLWQAFHNYRDSQYRGDIIYYRQPSDLSPAVAAVINDVMLTRETPTGRQLSATILSLASKRAIALIPVKYKDRTNSGEGPVTKVMRSLLKGKQQSMEVVINPVCSQDRASLALSYSEEACLTMLEGASDIMGAEDKRFDLYEMVALFSSTEAGPGKVYMEAFDKAIKYETNDADLLAYRHGLGVLAFLAVLLAAFILLAGFLPGTVLVRAPLAVLLVAVAAFSMRYGCSQVLSRNGQPMAGQVSGLRRYLLDFSDFSHRGVEDLVLWDRYLVYATAFGISDRVVTQLAQASPELTDSEWLNDNARGSLLYWTFLPYSQNVTAASSLGGPEALAANSALGQGGVIDLGTQLTQGLDQIGGLIGMASGNSSGSAVGGFGDGGGSFGGSGGGSGGGSFGGR
ncbi:DUF2207 family protein [Bifidobacterium sp. ESL0822]|uniref:DUF2207 family protein n=1 Tax=Bifidobacterium sp. ESL0822 TaxID=3448585 RepID=UPI0040413E75